MPSILLSAAYFPPVSWMAVAIQNPLLMIEQHETYPKQTFRNRCYISTASGVQGLSVPVKRIQGNHSKTKDIIIDNNLNWQQLHWRSITTAYNKSPYFLYYRDIIETIIMHRHKTLLELDIEIITNLINILRIKPKQLELSQTYEKVSLHKDLRNAFNPKNDPFQLIIGEFPRYIQVFEEKTGFLPDLSILDLLFNLGPDTTSYLSALELNLPSA